MEGRGVEQWFPEVEEEMLAKKYEILVGQDEHVHRFTVHHGDYR